MRKKGPGAVDDIKVRAKLGGTAGNLIKLFILLSYVSKIFLQKLLGDQ